MSKAKLVGTFRIALLPGVKEEDFERFMIKELMPNVNVFSRGVNDWCQSLFKSYQDDRGDRYVWTVTLEHFGSEHDVPGAIPSILAEIYEAAQAQIQEFGLRTEFSMFTKVG
jgi:hypothetical protein